MLGVPNSFGILVQTSAGKLKVNMLRGALVQDDEVRVSCVHLLTPKATAWKEIPLRKPQPGPLKWPHT